MTGLLIGLYSPQPGAGKTTLAEALERDLNAERIRFAGPFKAMLAGLLREVGTDEARIHEMLDGSLKEQPARELLGRTPRFAMQRLGTEFGRQLMHPDIWTELLRLRAEPLLAQGRIVVVDDMRFQNEAALIREMGGKLIRIDRPVTSADVVALAHASEGALDGEAFDLLLVNHARSAAAWGSRARAIVEALTKGRAA